MSSCVYAIVFPKLMSNCLKKYNLDVFSTTVLVAVLKSVSITVSFSKHFVQVKFNYKTKSFPSIDAKLTLIESVFAILITKYSFFLVLNFIVRANSIHQSLCNG